MVNHRSGVQTPRGPDPPDSAGTRPAKGPSLLAQTLGISPRAALSDLLAKLKYNTLP